MRSAVKAYNWTCTATTTDVTVFNGWLIRGEDGRLTVLGSLSERDAVDTLIGSLWTSGALSVRGISPPPRFRV